MRQINLKANDSFAQRDNSSSKGTMSLFIGIFILFVTASIYGFLLYENKKLDSDIASVKAKMEEQTNKLKGRQYKELYDFQGRLLDMASKMSGYVKQSDNLEAISRATLPRTEFKALNETVEGKKSRFEASFLVPDQDYLSEQIESFKGINGISNVALSSSSQEEIGVVGSIAFELEKKTSSDENKEKTSLK